MTDPMKKDTFTAVLYIPVAEFRDEAHRGTRVAVEATRLLDNLYDAIADEAPFDFFRVSIIVEADRYPGRETHE